MYEMNTNKNGESVAYYWCYTDGSDTRGKRLYNYLKRQEIQYWVSKCYSSTTWEMMLTDQQLKRVTSIAGEVWEPN